MVQAGDRAVGVVVLEDTFDSLLFVVASACSVAIVISVTETSVVDKLRTGGLEAGGWVGLVVLIEDPVVVEVNSLFSSVVYLTVDVEVVLV